VFLQIQFTNATFSKRGLGAGFLDRDSTVDAVFVLDPAEFSWDDIVLPRGSTGFRFQFDKVVPSDGGLDFCGSFQLFTQGTLGDLNGDDIADRNDVDAFILALTDPNTYEEIYPWVGVFNADVNGDGRVNAFDIDPFITLITLGVPPGDPGGIEG